MADPIDRQMAIDALWKALYEYEDETEKQFIESDELDIGDWMQHRIFVQNMSDIDRQTILNLAPAQTEQRWIPVGERLPENEYVLISKKPTKISGSKWSVTIAIRTADPRSGKIQWRDIGFGVIQDDKVLAWMPLPKPYKEERDAD